MPDLTEQEAEAAIRKMASEIGDPLGGVLRALLKMLDAERAKIDAMTEERDVIRAKFDDAVRVTCAASNDAERALRESDLL